MVGDELAVLYRLGHSCSRSYVVVYEVSEDVLWNRVWNGLVDEVGASRELALESGSIAATIDTGPW